MVNTVILSIYDYSDRESLTTKNKIIDKIDLFLTYIFVFEALTKIFAMGFIFHKYSYLRDGWNVIDFSIAFTG